MSSVTRTIQFSSEKHMKLGRIIIPQDVQYLSHLPLQLGSFNSFDIHGEILWFLSSGRMAQDGDGINCDDDHAINKTVQKNLNNLTITRAEK